VTGATARGWERERGSETLARRSFETSHNIRAIKSFVGGFLFM
jgi:hypothetical protein